MLFWKNAWALPSFAFLFISLFSCQSEEKKSAKSSFENTDRYDISSPKVIQLPELLDEISGIAYYPKDTSVFAIVDEMGLLFKIPLNNVRDYKFWEFDKPRDYEDLVLIDSTFYILVSKGDILKLRFENDRPVVSKTDFNLDGDVVDEKIVNEFESLMVSDSGNLILICKECDADSKPVVSSFQYNLSDTAGGFKAFIKFNMQLLAAERDGHLKASAAAINPITKEIYLISSVQKVLVIADQQGNVKQTIKLDPKIYKQPEGIAFTPDGDLIISNEFADVGLSNLLLLKNKMKGL